MFLALSMVFSMAVGAYAEETEADAAPALVLEVNQGKASATVDVYLQGCDGVTNGSFSVSYDPSVFTLAGTETTGAYAKNSINSETAGTVSFAWVGSQLTAEKTLMLTLNLEAVNGYIEESMTYTAVSGGIFAGTEDVEAEGASLSVSYDGGIDTSALERAIAIAEGIKEGTYTSESYKALKDALAKAIAVLANSDSTQEEINAATLGLYAAINALVPADGTGVEVITPETGSSEETENPGTGTDFSLAAVIAVIAVSAMGIFVSMRSKQARKFLCLILAVTMIVSVAPVNAFAQVINGQETERNEDNPTDLSGLQQAVEELQDSITEPETEEITGSAAEIEDPGVDLKIEQSVSDEQIALYNDDEIVRVIIELEGKGLLEQGYTQNQIAAYGLRVSSDAAKLEKMQSSVAAQVETVVGETGLLSGSESVEVKYNFTIAMNGLSMDVPYGAIDEIKNIEGVKSVCVATEYSVPESVSTDTVSPTMYATSETFGSAKTWSALGYTGAGMVIAVVDTGLDTDHPSFVDAPEGATMTVEDVERVLTELNAYKLYSATSAVALKASQLYRNEKVPYGFNYADGGLDITHDYDEQGDHGSHVAGIAAANKIDSTSVVGVAPDAQLVIMKVFGQNSTGATTDTIIAAIEDCLLLDVDVVNMSLGSPAGFCEDYALVNEVYGRILETDMLLAVAAGNGHTSASGNSLGTNLNYTEDPDNGIVTSPGTYLAATTVASLENTEMMMPYFMVGENKVAYVDVTYYNFAALEGTYEYVVVPGVGEASDYEGLDVSGKIALVKRGTVDFTTKQENAYRHGAVALVVYDNVEGDLVSMYDGGFLPNVFVSKADGELMIAAAENGIGTLTIMPYGEETAVANSVAGLISDFSSWGVTSDLQLTPDVAAPGGNIYSCYTDGQYGTMSGTSMASPHIAGMSALVLQYLHDQYPDLSEDQYHVITESLVMCTAVPVYDENGILYAPRAQGAGSANVYSAVTSPVYLTGYQESTGELTPKASVGDDPERTGVYTFSFTMNNLTGKEQVYALGGNVLTDQYLSYEGKEYMSETGRNLSAKVTFEAENAGLASLEYDVNKDGVTDMNDVQYMLDYVNGVEKNLDEVFAKIMNFHGDEVLNTVDVQIFYEMLLSESVTAADLVTVPANGSVVVNVTVTLSADDMAYMEAHYPNGIYVDGFVRAYAQTEGAVDLSFPFVGFYGDWTDARMFDSGWYYEDDDVEYNRYWNVIFTTLGSDTSSMGGLGLNPYLADDTYSTEHNVLSPNGDTYYDYVPDIYISLMRSAKLLEFVWTDSEGNELFYDDYEYARKSFYWSAYGICLPAMYIDGGCSPFTMYDENGNLMVEDLDKLTLTIRGYLDDGDIEGILVEDSPRPDPAWADEVVEIPVTIDLYAPTIDLSTIEYFTEDDRNYVRFVVEDNYDIAAIVTTTAGGGTYDYIPVNTKTEGVDGEKATIEIDITDYDAKFNIVVCDYGCNENYYELTNESGTGLSGDRFYAYRRYSYVETDSYMYATDQLNGWYSFESTDVMMAHTSQASSGEATVFAAEYVDGYIFGAQSGSDAYGSNSLFVTKAGSWDRTELGNLRKIVYQWPGTTKTYFPLYLIALDMTYDYTSDTMYILANGLENNYFPEGIENLLLSMDILTGTWNLLGIIEPAVEGEDFLALTLACDNDGVLYTINQRNGQLYTIDVEGAVSAYGDDVTTITNPMNIYTATSVDEDGKVSYYPAAYTQSMTFDHETNRLYWAGYQGMMGTSYFLELDKNNGGILAITRTADNAELDALIKPWNSGKDIVPDAELEYITFDESEIFLNLGQSATLTVMPSPYNAVLGEIEWYSDNEEVATVNEYGIVEAKGIGSAVILASCGWFEAECTVNVSDVDGTLFAYSSGSWYLMDAGSPSAAVQVVDTMELDGDVKAAAYFGGSIYAASVSGDYGAYSTTIYKLDASTLYGEALNSFGGEITALAFSYSDGFLYGVLRTYNSETECDEYDLVRINTKSGDYIVAASLKELYNSENWDLCSGALAIDYEGNFYVNGSNAEGWNDIYTLKRFNFDENGRIANVTTYSDFDIMGYSGDAMIWSERNNGILHIGGNELRWVDVSDMSDIRIIELGTVRGAGYNVYALAMPLNSEPELPVVVPTAVMLEESYSVPAGETTKVNPSTDPWNATGEFTFETADTSIATVDENGVVTGITEGETTITVTETLSGLSATAKIIVEKNPGYIYGYFQAYITEALPMEVWGRIPISNPEEFTQMTSGTYSLTIYAAAYYDGFVYACGQHSTDGKYYMLRISPSNFAYEIIGEPDFLVRDMAFDYTTGTMYAVGYDEVVKGGLYAFDIKTGEFTFIADNDMGATLVALACDNNGVLYAADDYGEVVIVDKETAVLQSTGIYGGYSMYFQSMVYDYNNDTIYWAKGGSIYEVDVEKGTMKSIGTTGCSVSGLFTVPQTEIEVPESVEPAGVVLAEKNTVAVGETLAVEAVVLPVSVSAVDKSLSWSSSDESIAVVDANGIITGVSEGEVNITATDKNGNSDTVFITVTAEHRYFYGYDELSNSWVQFDTDGKIRKSWPDAEGASPIAAAQYIDGVLYAYDEDGYFYSVDTETFERTLLGDGIHGLLADGLQAYDQTGTYYVDGVPYKMIDLDYAVVQGRRGTVTKFYGVMMAYNISLWQDDFSYIFAELDIENGKIVQVIVSDMLVDYEMSLRPTNLIYRGGYLYTVNGYITGMVTRIDLGGGEVTGTAIFPEYWGDFNGGRSLLEDPLTGTVYAIRDKRTDYIGQEDYTGEFSESVLCTVNLGIAKCDVIATVGTNVRLTGMFIK